RRLLPRPAGHRDHVAGHLARRLAGAAARPAQLRAEPAVPGRTWYPSGAHRPVRRGDRSVPGGAGPLDRHRRTGKDLGMIVELRRYTLRAGRRDELIELFDREFVETQE